jgi:hypothetical protein
MDLNSARHLTLTAASTQPTKTLNPKRPHAILPD